MLLVLQCLSSLNCALQQNLCMHAFSIYNTLVLILVKILKFTIYTSFSFGKDVE